MMVVPKMPSFHTLLKMSERSADIASRYIPGDDDVEQRGSEGQARGQVIKDSGVEWLFGIGYLLIKCHCHQEDQTSYKKIGTGFVEKKPGKAVHLLE